MAAAISGSASNNVSEKKWSATVLWTEEWAEGIKSTCQKRRDEATHRKMSPGPLSSQAQPSLPWPGGRRPTEATYQMSPDIASCTPSIAFQTELMMIALT